MGRVKFLGDSLQRIKDFPRSASKDAGYQLGLVENGEEPLDWKPMPTVGPGVREIRIWASDGTFRVTYVVRSRIGVFVLHAFAKTTELTSKRDIDLARARLKDVP
jgi:phage-related protein